MIRFGLLFASIVLLLFSCGGTEGNSTSSVTTVSESFASSSSSSASSASSSSSSSSSSSAAFDRSVEGAYVGTSNSGTTIEAIVGNAGDFWLVYGSPEVLPQGATAATPWLGFLKLEGFMNGKLSAASGVVQATSIKEFTSTGQSYPLKVDGKYSSGNAKKLDATIASTNESSVVSLASVPVDSYSYVKIPKLADIAGNWTGKELLAATSATAKITTLDALAQKATLAVKFGSCEAIGEITPRTSSLASENLFDLILNTGEFCGERSNREFSGVAIKQTIANGKSQMMLMSVTPDRSFGLAVWASK